MDRFTEQSAADLESNSQLQPEDDWNDEDWFEFWSVYDPYASEYEDAMVDEYDFGPFTARPP